MGERGFFRQADVFGLAYSSCGAPLVD